jgi:hypothetical protein
LIAASAAQRQACRQRSDQTMEAISSRSQISRKPEKVM